MPEQHRNIIEQYTTTYAWAKVAEATGRYTLRKTSMTLPDARVIAYQYRSAGGLHDYECSRVTAVADNSVGLALYDYLGVGTVVRTRAYQISCMSRVFDDSNAIVDLDVFNRITTSRWTKDLGTDRDFYQVALTYDRDSNITSALDGVHGNYNSVGTRWDVAYTMDNVNRLTEAKEGTLSGGSITSTARDEQWTLSHTGNWDREKLDLNGDGDFVDASELDDTRTHNAVNELTARDTDTNGSANYSPSYDAAGNMTDDAKDYKYVYDVWGRLRMVKQTGNSALVAEYRYNGLNHRIGVHEDREPDGDVDANDAWWYDVFDERWRELARYSGSESSPREDFVPHQAGASGHGGSSYIDLVICRNKDTDVNGSLEERTFYCQNWRADVSAIVSSGGVMKEWVKYSTYGTPIGLPGGDTDSDGDCDSTDVARVNALIGGIYDVRADIDLSGTIDSADATAATGYSGTTLGRDVLSASGVVNRKGYAGYEALSGCVDCKWIARTRVLSSLLGDWQTRDDLSNIGGRSDYEYCDSEPVALIDSHGLMGFGADVSFSHPVMRGCPAPSFSVTATSTFSSATMAQFPSNGETVHAPRTHTSHVPTETWPNVVAWLVQRVCLDCAHAQESWGHTCTTVQQPWDCGSCFLEAAPITAGMTFREDNLAGGEFLRHTEGHYFTFHDVYIYLATRQMNREISQTWGYCDQRGGNCHRGPFYRDHASTPVSHGATVAHYSYEAQLNWECACGHTGGTLQLIADAPATWDVSVLPQHP